MVDTALTLHSKANNLTQHLREIILIHRLGQASILLHRPMKALPNTTVNTLLLPFIKESIPLRLMEITPLITKTGHKVRQVAITMDDHHSSNALDIIACAL